MQLASRKPMFVLVLQDIGSHKCFFLVILCLILLSSAGTDLCGAVYPMGGR